MSPRNQRRRCHVSDHTAFFPEWGVSCDGSSGDGRAGQGSGSASGRLVRALNSRGTIRMSPSRSSPPQGWLAGGGCRPDGAAPLHQQVGWGTGGGWGRERPRVLGSRRLKPHLVTAAAFASLLLRQKPLALPWQPGSIHVPLAPGFSVTMAEPLKTCLETERHEQKMTPGHRGERKAGGRGACVSFLFGELRMPQKDRASTQTLSVGTRRLRKVAAWPKPHLQSPVGQP